MRLRPRKANPKKSSSNELDIRYGEKAQMKSVKGEINRIPRVGEGVIIGDENISRGNWKLGKIEELIKSDVDEIPRAAVVIIASGKRLKRPFRVLYPLEGNCFMEKSDKKK